MGLTAPRLTVCCGNRRRAVLSAVAPTLLRRIESGWFRSAPGAGNKDLVASTPLPDFLPSALFQDLLLPEVEVEAPPGRGPREPERMAVQQAVREFAPGRVTHRFAVGRSVDRLWVPAGDGASSTDVAVNDFVRADPLVDLDASDGDERPVRVLRPWKVLPISPHASVADSSNARPRWRSVIGPVGRVVTRPAPGTGGWPNMVGEVRFHLHQAGGRPVVYRAATGSDATVTVNGETRMFSTRFVDNEGAVAVGFQLDVDGLSFDVKDPGDWAEVLDRDPVRARGLRADWFRYRVRQHPALGESTSVFKRDWLSELALAALVQEASASHDLDRARRTAQAATVGRGARPSSYSCLSVRGSPTQVTGAEAASEEVNVTRLHQDLVALARGTAAVEAVSSALDDLLCSQGGAFEAWLRERYLSTVAAAMAHGAALLYEEASIEELVVDVSPWKDGRATVWISEQRPGGVGVMEGVFERFQEDPRRFWRLVSGTVAASEREVVDSELCRTIELVVEDPELASLFATVRASRRQDERTVAWRRLIRGLDQRGVTTSHGVRVALSLVYSGRRRHSRLMCCFTTSCGAGARRRKPSA